MYKTALGFCTASVFSSSADMNTVLVLVLVATVFCQEETTDKTKLGATNLAAKETTDKSKSGANISIAEEASEKTKRGASGLSNGYIINNGHGKLFYTQEVPDSNGGLTFSQGNSNNGGSANVGFADLSSQFVQFNTVTRQVPVPVPQPIPVTLNRAIPVPVPAPYPVTVPRPIPVPQPVPVPVFRPVPVTVPRPIPVPVAQPVPVPVPQTYTVPIHQAVPVQVPQLVAVPVPQPITVEVPHPVVVQSGNGPASSGVAYESVGAGHVSGSLKDSLGLKPISVIGISGHGLGANTAIAGINKGVTGHYVNGKISDYRSGFAGHSSASNVVPSLHGSEYTIVPNIAPSKHNSGPLRYIYLGYSSGTSTDSSGKLTGSLVTASKEHGSGYPLITNTKPLEKVSSYPLTASTGHSSRYTLETSAELLGKPSNALAGVGYDSESGVGALGQRSQTQFTSGYSVGSNAESLDQSSGSLPVISSEKNSGYRLGANSGLISHGSGSIVHGFSVAGHSLSGDSKDHSSTHFSGSNTAKPGQNLRSPSTGHTFIYTLGTSAESSPSKGHASDYRLVDISKPVPSEGKNPEYNLGTGAEPSSSPGHTSLYSIGKSAGSSSSAGPGSGYRLRNSIGSDSSKGNGYNVGTSTSVPSIGLSSGHNLEINADSSTVSAPTTGHGSGYNLGTNEGSVPSASLGYSVGHIRTLNSHTSVTPGQPIIINTGIVRQNSISPASHNNYGYNVGDNSVSSGHNLVYTTKNSAGSENYRTYLFKQGR